MTKYAKASEKKYRVVARWIKPMSNIFHFIGETKLIIEYTLQEFVVQTHHWMPVMEANKVYI